MHHFIICGLIVAIILLNCSNGDEVDVKKPICKEKEKSLAFLDIAEDLVNNAKVVCFKSKNTPKQSDCSGKEKSPSYMRYTRKLLREIRKDFPSCRPAVCIEKPRDCTELLAAGYNRSGTYDIFPMSQYTVSKRVRVYCDMDTDGGGWTVIQRRGNFTPRQDFELTWKEYKKGFGNIERDFYLGNDYIYTLSNQSPVELRIELKDSEGEQRYAVYKKFRIGDERNYYKMYISGYEGNAGDGMTSFNLMKFRTMDKGNAADGVGGWWISPTYTDTQLNGKYDSNISFIRYMRWGYHQFWYSDDTPGEKFLVFVEMKVREI